MECGTREQRELLFATGVQQDFPLGRIPVAAEEDLKDYDPVKPIYRGWDSYRYAPEEVDAGPAAETSLERAMRLRREFLDALKECGASAAQEFSLFEGGEPPAAKEPRTDVGIRNHDAQGGGARSGGDWNQGKQKDHPAAPTAHPPQPQLSKELASARSLPSEDTPIISDSGGTVSLDVDAMGEDDVGQREGGAAEHARPPSGPEGSDCRRKPPIAVMDVLPEDRATSAGQAPRDPGINAEEREEGREEKDDEEVEGRRLSEKDGKSLHVERGEPQTLDQTDHDPINGADMQPQEAVGEHKQRTTKLTPTKDENEPPTSGRTRSAVEAAGRRVGGVMMADTGAVKPAPHETKDDGGHDSGPAGIQWGRDGGVVPFQKRAAEAADSPNQGAELEYGNSGVWEHMEGEVGTPTGGTIMKAMIAGIMVSVPLPSEAFCAWGKRASPTNSGSNDSRAGRDDDNNHSSKTLPSDINKPPRKTSTRALLSRLCSRSHTNTGTTQKGTARNDPHPVDANTAELSALGKDSITPRAVGEINSGNSGEQEARAGRRRSLSRTAAGPTSTSAPGLPPAVVEGVPTMDRGARARESNNLGKRDQDELRPGKDDPGKLLRGRERVADGKTIRGRRDNVVVSELNHAARRAAPAVVASEAGERTRATARGEAADTGPGVPAGSEAYSGPSPRKVRGELPPAEDHNNTRKASLDVGVGFTYAAPTGTWGTGSRVEEDQAAAAAASAIAGVGWRNLRRDTVTALVRQLGRATAERDRIRQQPEIDLRKIWPREDNHNGRRHLSSSPPTRRRVHHRQHSEAAPAAATAAAAAATAPLPLYGGDNNGVPPSAWGEYQPRHQSSHISSSQRRQSCDDSGSTGATGTRNTDAAGKEEDRRRRWEEQAREPGGGAVPCGFPRDSSPAVRRARRASAGGVSGAAGAAAYRTTPYKGGSSPSRQQQERLRREVRRQGTGTRELGVSGVLEPIPSSPPGRYEPRTGLRQAGFSSTPSPSARQQQQPEQQGSLWTRQVEATAGFDVSSIPSPAGQAGCSPRPRSTRQAALLMRGAIRSLVRSTLLSAWRRWRATLHPPPRPRQQRSTTSPGIAAAVPNYGSVREGRVRGEETSAVPGGSGDDEALATAVADKEEMWRQRQAVLLSFVSGPENDDKGGGGSGERLPAASSATAAKPATTAVTAAATPAPAVTGAVSAESLGKATLSPGHGEKFVERRPPRSLAGRSLAWQQRGREPKEKGEEPDGDDSEGEEGGVEQRDAGERDGGQEGGAKVLAKAERFRQKMKQCSESSSRLEDREAAKGQQQLPPPPAPLRSPRSPECGGAGGDAVLTPGSRRSRNSMQRQTFSASSSNSSWKDRGNLQPVDDLHGPDSPTPPFPPAASPVIRRWRQPPVDHQLGDISSPAAAYAEGAAADGAVAAASMLVVPVDLGGSSPKSPASIHGYGYRSPRFGSCDDEEGDVCGGGGGGGGGGFTPGRALSGAVSHGGVVGAAVAAREPTGWTRPVLEGGSLRLAADERNKAAPWRPPGSPGSASVVATSVAAAAAASAAMSRPAINVRRNRTSGGTPRQSSTGRQTGRRTRSPEDAFFHSGGDGDGDGGGSGYEYGEEDSPRSAGGAHEEWLAGARGGGAGPGLFEPPSSPTTGGHIPVKAASSRHFPERQHRQHQHQHQHQNHREQQRSKPMYLAPTASSRHKHKRRSTYPKGEANHPVKTETSTPNRRGRRATRASGGVCNRRALAAAPRPAFRPGGIAKPQTLSPSPSPSPPRTRKQSLERREASQSISPPRSPRQQHGRAVPSAPPTKHGGAGDYSIPASPPQRAPRQQHGSPPSRAKPQRQSEQRRRARPSPQASAPERVQERRGGGSGGVWDGGRGSKQQQDTGEGGGRRIAGDERGGEGRAGARRESYPYGAVYSRSFDTGEFFSGVGSSTPAASPNYYRRRRGESGERSQHNTAAPGRVAEPSSSRGGGRGGGREVPRGSASTTFDAPRTQGSRQSQEPGHPGRWFSSSYAECHAATTPTVATGGEESWGDGGRRVDSNRRRRSSTAAVVAGSGGTRALAGDSSYYGS